MDAPTQLAENRQAVVPQTDQTARNRRESDELLAAVSGRSDRRRWPSLLAGLLVGGVVALGLASVLDGGDDEDEAAVTVGLSSADVATADLSATVTYDGTLGFGDERSVGVPGDGTVTSVAAVGDVIERGDVLAVIDDVPVVVLYGSTPLWRELAAEETGSDVSLLEENLVALGLDPDGTISVDGSFSWRTEQAVFRWQDRLGLEQTGTVPDPMVIVMPGPTVVTQIVAIGDQVRSGESLASLVDASFQSVTVMTSPSEFSAFVAGDAVTVELPDGTEIEGVVFAVATAAEAASTGQAGAEVEASIEVVIGLVGAVPDTYREGPVTVLVAEEESLGVTVVPTRALVSLNEGGLAVEVIEADGSTTLVGVETGLYDDGLVEVTNGNVQPGDKVVVPS